MDERVRISLWLVGGGGLGALLGGAFGALTGALYWNSGRSAGTRFGHAVADSFARAAGREPSRLRRGAIVGAADGVLFLGALGILAGGLGAAGPSGGSVRWLASVMLTGLLLVIGGVFFGLLAYALVRNGTWAVVAMFAGGVLGAVGSIGLLGPDYFLLGVLPGLFAGLLFSFRVRRWAPTFRPPWLGARAPRSRPDADTDITGPPRRSEGPDSIRKAEPEEE
jgi:hypothetical protein